MTGRSVILVGVILLSRASICPAEPTTSAPALDHELIVPIDHAAPIGDSAAITYEFAAPFDAKKPTIFILADAQQFFLTKGSVARLQRDSYGPDFNVVGIMGRGSSEGFRSRAIKPNGEIDWLRAWQIFRSDQWLNDIEAVRKQVVGPEGKISLFGGSGGGFLAIEYLAKYGAHVARAFVACPIAPLIMGEAGLCSDHFWEQASENREQLELIRKALRRHVADRAVMVQTIQRQHYFVPADKLMDARTTLLRSLAEGDEKKFEEYRREYQVDAVRGFYDSPIGVAIRVREFEFLFPTGRASRLQGDALYPELEVQYEAARPLFNLVDQGALEPTTTPMGNLRNFGGEVFLLAARWDEATDYRAMIALAQLLPHHHLLIVDDNHNFERLSKKGLYKRLVNSFLAEGLGSTELESDLKAAAACRWIEK